MSSFNIINFLAITLACPAALPCSKTVDLVEVSHSTALSKRKVWFDVSVKPDGKHLPTEPLLGLKHLRKLTATYAASAGIYLKDLVLSRIYITKSLSRQA